MEEFFKSMIKEFCDKDEKMFDSTISEKSRTDILQEIMGDEQTIEALTDEIRDIIFETSVYQSTMGDDE